MLVDAEVAKLLISGPPGAGKTTAIRALSEIPPISSEVLATDDLALEKEETTVGLDFGQITLEDGEVLAIYGTPGQVRFSFMWDILKDGAQGLILLLNHLRPDPLADLREFVPTFADMFAEGVAVVGVSRYDTEIGPALQSYADLLAELGVMAPVVAVDVRERDDVLLLVETLAMLGCERLDP
jgi:signal recognition particle receptor subunit beta